MGMCTKPMSSHNCCRAWVTSCADCVRSTVRDPRWCSSSPITARSRSKSHTQRRISVQGAVREGGQCACVRCAATYCQGCLGSEGRLRPRLAPWTHAVTCRQPQPAQRSPTGPHCELQSLGLSHHLTCTWRVEAQVLLRWLMLPPWLLLLPSQMPNTHMTAGYGRGLSVGVGRSVVVVCVSMCVSMRVMQLKKNEVVSAEIEGKFCKFDKLLSLVLRRFTSRRSLGPSQTESCLACCYTC